MTAVAEMLAIAPERDRAISFGASRKSEAGAEFSARELFHCLLNLDRWPNVRSAVLESVKRRFELATDTYPDGLQYFPFDLDALAKRCAQIRRSTVKADASVEATDKARLQATLVQYAPAALTDGSWLQNALDTSIAHTFVSARLGSLYAYEIGDGSALANHGQRYESLLRTADISLPAVVSEKFVRHEQIHDFAFELPAFLLGVSTFTRTFLSEILGITLWYYTTGGYPRYSTCGNDLQHHGISAQFFEIHDPYGEEIDGRLRQSIELVTSFLDNLSDDESADSEWRRVWSGFVAAHRLQAEFERSLDALATSPQPSPAHRMAEMLQKKAFFGCGFHRTAELGSRRIDDWLGDDEVDAAGILDALADSHWVKPGNSAASPLLTNLVKFRGPMFRVFSPEELATIAEWIDALPATAPEAADLTAHIEIEPSPRTSAAATLARCPHLVDKYRNVPARELYYYLINFEFYPDILAHGEQLVVEILASAKHTSPPFPYGHTPLGEWFRATLREQLAAYTPLVGAPDKTEHRVKWGIEQFGPYILVDGCWLQHTFKPGVVDWDIASILFNTYWDEIGNGELPFNHPNMYRKLIDELGIELPRFDTLEFANWPGFADSAFDRPIYLLAISLFPRKFLPEILGLNLAIELSGIGGSYSMASDAWRYYKIDSALVDVHNTIDNASTGHAAWACTAIETFMDRAISSGDVHQMEEAWRRIWSGYASLDEVLVRYQQDVKQDGVYPGPQGNE